MEKRLLIGICGALVLALVFFSLQPFKENQVLVYDATLSRNVTLNTSITLDRYEPGSDLTYLIIGIDARKRDEPSRSDTVILLRFDLENKTYSTESIPRDTYIENGFDNKLGGVHAMGGPGLVIKRIREYFRTPIHHYMKLNFNGFEEMVDILGGIDINVTETINDTTYPAPDYGYMKVYIPEGQHHLTGAVALQYARSRHNAPLFARDCRQQSFIEAFAEQKVTLRNVLKAPALYLVLKSNFYTDMSGIQLLNLARLLHRSTLDKKMLHPSESRMIYNDAFKMDLSYQIPAKKPQEAC